MAAPSEGQGAAEDRAEPVDISVRGLGIALVGAFLGYYFITGMPQLRLNPLPPTLTLHLVTAALVLVYVAYLALYRRLPGGTPIDWAVGLLVGAYALATIASINWRVSLENMFQVFMAVVVFYALSDIRILSARGVQRGLMLAGAAASFKALWVVGQDYGDWLALARSVEGLSLRDLVPPTVLRVHDVSDHPNILAMTLILTVPFYVLAIYRPEAWWERAGGVVGLLAAILTIFLTVSRGAWFGAVISLVVTAGGIVTLALVARGVALSPDLPLRWLRRQRVAIILVAVALAAVVAVGALIAAGSWESRPQWLFHSSLSPRQDVFSAGFDMFKDYPLLGAGPNTYALLYPEYSGEFPVHGVHAHNAYLQAAIDLGLVGLGALLVLGGVLGWMLWRTVRGGTSSQQFLAVGAAGALVGFLAHGLVDAPNTWKAPVIALAAVGAIIVGNYREARTPATATAGDASPQAGPATSTALRMRRFLPLVPRLLILVVVIALLAGWGRIDAAHFYYARAITRAAEDRLPEAVSDASRAVDLDPQFAIYQLQLGLTEAQAYMRGGSPTLLDEAVRHLRRGVELEPRSAIGYANLARALEMAGQGDEASAAALEARRWGGTDEAIMLATGAVFEDLGETDDAIQTYGEAISLNTGLADSSFWVSSSFRQEHYNEIISHSALAFNACGFGGLLARSEGRLAGMAGADLSDLASRCAEQVVSPRGELTHRIDLGEILLALGDVDGAEKQLRFVVEREPDNGRARTALGNWYEAQGDVEAARREWLLASQLEDPAGVLQLGDSYPPGEVPEEVIRKLGDLMYLAGSAVQHDLIGILYYRMKFGRGSPVTILIPGDWQQAVPGQYQRMQQALLRWREGA